MKSLICLLAAAALFTGCATKTETERGSPDTDVGTQSGTQTNGNSGIRTNSPSSTNQTQTPTQTPRGN